MCEHRFSLLILVGRYCLFIQNVSGNDLQDIRLNGKLKSDFTHLKFAPVHIENIFSPRWLKMDRIFAEEAVGHSVFCAQLLWRVWQCRCHDECGRNTNVFFSGRGCFQHCFLLLCLHFIDFLKVLISCLYSFMEYLKIIIFP